MRFPIRTAPSSEQTAAALSRAVVVPALVRLFLIVVVAGVLVFVAPARPSSATTPTPTAAAPTATPPAAGSPLAEIIDFIAEMNAGDLPSVYAALSPDVQQQFTLDGLTEAIQDISLSAGPLHFTLVSVDSSTETADQAEIELTLRVQAGSSLDITLREVASLVRIDGVWRVADHFLQSAFTAIGLVRPGPLTRTFDAQGCVAGDVLEGVYAPSRLQVIQPCVTVTGVVHGIEHALDGDITFNLALPPDKTFLLNDANLRDHDGMLHIEIIPGDQQRVQTPTEGEAVTVTGPWVTDLVHGPNEIHPAWLIAQKPPVGGVSLDPMSSARPASASRSLPEMLAAVTAFALIATAGAAWYTRKRTSR